MIKKIEQALKKDIRKILLVPMNNEMMKKNAEKAKQFIELVKKSDARVKNGIAGGDPFCSSTRGRLLEEGES